MIATAMSEQTMRMTSSAMTMPRQLRCDGLLPTSSCRNTQHITHVKCHSCTKCLYGIEWTVGRHQRLNVIFKCHAARHASVCACWTRLVETYLWHWLLTTLTHASRCISTLVETYTRRILGPLYNYKTSLLRTWAQLHNIRFGSVRSHH